MSLQRRLEKEIESIENDDSLTNDEKAREIRELERDAYNYAIEQAQERYNDEMERNGYYEY
jgi:DNA-binding protein YbaB